MERLSPEDIFDRTWSKIQQTAVAMPGEREAIVDAIAAADAYGFGNLIAWLSTAWARRLVEGGLNPETAAHHVTGRNPYPLP